LAANCLGVLPQTVLAIENTPVAIVSAKSSGMTVVDIATSHEKSALKNANYINCQDRVYSWWLLQ
jgi:beta-phosphoglucomutase-like phosphatase (HAD superfamily)